MADVPDQPGGRFILSLNAVEGVFKTFSRFQIEEVDCSYSVQGQGRSKDVKEVIITARAK
jgi:DNA adenine methylase